MWADTHDTTGTDTAGIRLNLVLHRQLFKAIGCETDAAIAAETGVSDRTIRRAREGVIGEVFMSKTITALRRHEPKLLAHGLQPPTLADLFSVPTGA